MRGRETIIRHDSCTTPQIACVAVKMTTKLFLATLPLLLSFVLFAPQTTGRNVSHPRPCDRDRCPIPTCANPDFSVDTCCGSCSQSKCIFRGCVQYGAFGPTWWPNPCKSCQCTSEGLEDCITENCSRTSNNQCETLGYRIVRPPGACCPKCDYGIPSNSCVPVRAKKENLTVSIGKSKCEIEVVLHGCDKQFVLRDGSHYYCQPVKQNRAIKLRDAGEGDCELFRRVVIRDVRQCRVHSNAVIYDGGPPQRHCALQCDQTGCVHPPRG